MLSADIFFYKAEGYFDPYFETLDFWKEKNASRHFLLVINFMSAHYDYDYESDAMTSETTDSADWSDSSSTDLDQTVHTGRKGALGSNRTGGGRKSVVGNKGGVKIPDPLYSVRIPTSTKVGTRLVTCRMRNSPFRN